MVAELADDLRLADPPPDAPDANRIEWSRRMSLRAVAPNHRYPDLAALRAAAGA